jgi:hypothetical protein
MKQVALALALVASLAACGAPAESDSDDADLDEAQADLVAVTPFEIYTQIGETAFWDETQKLHSEVVFCVNNGADYGNFVDVANDGGRSIEGPIVVAIGVENEADGSQTFAPARLTRDTVVQAGGAARLAGPYCSGVEVVYREGETLRVFVSVDPDDVIAEADEDNNFGYAPDALPL